MIDYIYGIVAILIVLFLFSKLLELNAAINKKEHNIDTQNTETTNQNKVQEDTIIKNNWDECYEPIYFMTRNEKAHFRKILEWSKKNHFYVFAKVRLADLIKPRGNNQKLFWKIQAKHVDFVICDTQLRVRLIIELQDGSHYNASRVERDSFMKEVLESCGYKTMWVYNINENDLNKELNIEPEFKQESFDLN